MGKEHLTMHTHCTHTHIVVDNWRVAVSFSSGKCWTELEDSVNYHIMSTSVLLIGAWPTV